MQNTIIIIESPNKKEKIAKITGAKVYATKGHFKELAQNFLNDYENYEPIFEFKENSKFNINQMIKDCKDSDVIIATDPDREGYGIAYLFYDLIKGTAKSIKRAEFHEITESGIKKGLDNSVNFANSNLKEFEAFKARVVGDKLVGFILSPKYINALNDKNNSVGRVQTPALNLIVKRELEINKFKNSPQAKQIDYKIKAKLKNGECEFFAINDNIYKTKDEAEAKLNELKELKTAKIFNIDTKQSQIKPHEPFRTSQYQEIANKKIGFNSEVAMNLAQKLFEKGLITYHRTDSNSLSNEFINEVQNYFKDQEWYEKREYKAGNQSQAQAHEAIRISHLHDFSEIENIARAENLTDDERKIYEMIFQNSILSQAKNSINEIKTYDFDILAMSFKTKSSKCIFKGFKGVFGDNETGEDEEEIKELNINENEQVEILNFELQEVKKQAPKHYKESNFISLLEKEGIGRPSTYASFLPRLLQRNYIEIATKGKNSEIIATQKGINFIAEISKNDEWITKSEFTKIMEEVLDKISKNEATYLDFIKPLHEKMDFVKISTDAEIKPPSEKQLEFAKKLAKDQNLELPKDIENNWKICNEFIEKAKKSTPPTEKQIAFAQKLANDQKIELPKNYDKSIEICSKFIDKCLKNGKK